MGEYRHSPLKALEVLSDWLFAVRATPRDFVLFGSMPMYFTGLRESVGDIDVFVKPKIYNRLKQHVMWREERPDSDDPPYLVLDINPPIHVFYDWTKRKPEVDPQRCFDLAEFSMGWPHAPLTEVLRWKDTPCNIGTKHVEDVEKIKEYLNGN